MLWGFAPGSGFVPITVICQQCSKRFDVPDSYQGREGKCTSCGAPLRVPVQAAPNLTASAEEAFAPPQSAAHQQPAAQQRPAVQQQQRQGVNLTAPASHVAIGRQIGSYELQRKLGPATSTVFLANSPQGEVAVKVLPAQLVDKNPTVGKRFLREARTLFGLSHPNVIRSHDAGEELGTFFLVMEFVPVSFKEHLKKSPQNIATFFRLAIDLAEEIALPQKCRRPPCAKSGSSGGRAGIRRRLWSRSAPPAGSNKIRRGPCNCSTAEQCIGTSTSHCHPRSGRG